MTRPKSPIPCHKERSESPSQPIRNTTRESVSSPNHRQESPKSTTSLTAQHSHSSSNASQEHHVNFNRHQQMSGGGINIKSSTSTPNISIGNNEIGIGSGSNAVKENGPEKLLPSPAIDRKDFDFTKVNGKHVFIFQSFLLLL